MVLQMIQDDVLLTFKEAMSYLRVSRSTLYRLMWSGQLTGHKAVQRVKERAGQQGENQYEIWEQAWGLASGDDLEMVSFLEREGYERQEMYYHCYRRPLIE